MFNKRLKELRKQRNMTQEALAALINVDRSSIGKYEGRSAVVPPADVLERIADVFNVSIDYLLRPESDENGEKDDVLNKEILRLLEKFSTDDKEKFVKVLRILYK